MQEDNNIDLQQEAKDLVLNELEKNGVINYMQVKTTNTHKETSFNNIKNSELFSKRISMHLPKSSYDELLIKNSNEKPCYESDSNHKYNKKFDLDIKNSAKIENTRHLKLPNEKMPSLFLSAIKTEKEKEKEKNLFIYKPKKKKKTVQIVIL